MQHHPTFITLAQAILLCACSAGPSEGEMQKAMTDSTKALGVFVKAEVKTVEKLGCERSGDAYLCDVRFEMLVEGQSVKQTSRLRFVESKDGWATSLTPS